METALFDYVKELNRISSDMVRLHGDLLDRKNIHGRRQLIQAIKLDLDKLTHALVEVRDNRGINVLENFFDGSAMDMAAIRARLVDTFIYHVGFRIHEPMSLVLEGINHWIELSNREFDTGMRVREFIRFPASPAMQQRVGAYVEIMRIWLEVGERSLMLELFDIHSPADTVLASAPPLTHRNFNGLVRQGDPAAGGHPERIARLFSEDEIWHYSLYVKREEDVVELQTELLALAERDSAYFLPYAEPVYNRHDGSFHTKIVRRAGRDLGRQELEFVTSRKP